MAGTARLAGLSAVIMLVAAWVAVASPAPVLAQSSVLDKQVRAIASRLRCPVCQNESVADSPSELAAQMRALIRTKLEEGESPETIVAYFISRYGEWILLDPPRQGLGWVLWSAPAVILVVGLAAAVRFIRRRVRPASTEAGAREDWDG